jgi:regulator of sigma E protease
MGMMAALPFSQLHAGAALSVFLGIVALGIVVFLHELGHFIVAKLKGMRVEVFSIGFPPKIWGIKKGDTEYRISWILVGGYVKLAGMEFEEGVDPRSVPDGYYASPIGTRLAVCACGPLMNLLSAFVIYCFLSIAGFPVPANMERTVIGTVVENSPAEKAGLKPGDRILGIDGKPVGRWEEVTKAVVFSTRPAVDLEWERGGLLFRERIIPEADEKTKLKRIGIYPPDIVSVEVLKGSVAGAAGMRDGDFISSVDGNTVYSWEQLTKAIRSREGKEVRLGLLRKGRPLTATVVPRKNEELGYAAIGVKLRLDVPMEDLEASGLVAYIYKDPFSWITGNVREMYLTFKGLILRAVSPRGLAGPIGIIQIMSYSMRTGLRQFLYVMAFISVNLAVVNLLPVPVLDGGHILLALIEGIKRGPLSARAMTVIQNVFVAILIALMTLVFANDIMRNWGESIARIIWHEGSATPTPAGKP